MINTNIHYKWITSLTFNLYYYKVDLKYRNKNGFKKEYNMIKISTDIISYSPFDFYKFSEYNS